MTAILSVAVAFGGSGRPALADGGLLTARVASLGRNLDVAWLRPPGFGPSAGAASQPHGTLVAKIGERTVVHRQGRLIAACQVMGRGQVKGNDQELIAVRVLSAIEPLQVEDEAVVIAADFVSTVRDDLPASVNIRGSVESLGPGRTNGWISLGTVDGLRTNDYVLVQRDALSVASGRVSTADAHRAAVELTSLVADVQVEPADSLSVWPAPWQSKQGQLESAVLAISDRDDEPLVTVAGGTMVGTSQGDAFEFHRDGGYVGVGEAVLVDDRLCQVQPVEGLSRTKVRVGDRAIRRPKKFASSPPMPARVFRIEKNYCLISVGERDGIENGQIVAVVREGKPIARLRLTAVKVDYSGAEVLEPRGNGQAISLWDQVFPEPFRPSRVLQVGSVTRVAEEGWAIGTAATVDLKGQLTGKVVGLQQVPSEATEICTGAGVVVAEGPAGMVVYSPRSWQTNKPDGAHVVLPLP